MLESGWNDRVMKVINPTIPPQRLGWLSFLWVVTAVIVPILKPKNTIIGAIPNYAPIKVTTPSPPLNLVNGEFQWPAMAAVVGMRSSVPSNPI